MANRCIFLNTRLSLRGSTDYIPWHFSPQQRGLVSARHVTPRMDTRRGRNTLAESKGFWAAMGADLTGGYQRPSPHAHIKAAA